MVEEILNYSGNLTIEKNCISFLVAFVWMPLRGTLNKYEFSSLFSGTGHQAHKVKYEKHTYSF